MRKPVAILLIILLVLSSASALACTGFYAGKRATLDGTIIIGHTVDAFTTNQSVTYTLPRVVDIPNRQLTTPYMAWDLPATTYGITTTPFVGGYFDSSVTNDMGVAVSAAITAYVSPAIAEMEPTVPGGLSEAFLCELVGLTAATAREGVEVLASFIDKLGNAEQNIILIADKNEAWYMETYTGKQWCAVRMPEDCVAVMGNQFMLGAVDVNSPDVLCSEGLISVPEAAGLAVFTEDGLIDLFATYSGNLLGDASNRRTWYGHLLLAPSTAGDYETHTRYALFYQPDAPVSLTDLFALTRSRFEGTEWECDLYDLVDQRVIGTEKQTNCSVIQTYPDASIPAALSCVTWTCMANAEHSVYLPLSSLLADTAPAYQYQDGYGYDLGLAHVHYKRLCALAEQDRVMYGHGVRDYWASVEAKLVQTYPSVLKRALSLYSRSPQEARQYITNWTIRLQEKTLAEADVMFDELMWYMIEHTIQCKTYYDAETLTMVEPPVPQKPFVPSLAANAE